MRSRIHRELALLAAIALAAAPACAPASGGQGTSAGPADSQAHPVTHGPAHTIADVEFVRDMLAHHQQALEMTALVPERAQNDIIRLLAERIEVSQRDEIARMEHWLRRRDEQIAVGGGEHAGMQHAAEHERTEEHAAMHERHHPSAGATSMSGMLTPAEMARLAAAAGAAFDRLFLQSMIRHHEGALVMVAELFSSPGAGQEPEIYQLASEIESDQRMEIDRMRGLLEALGR